MAVKLFAVSDVFLEIEFRIIVRDAVLSTGHR
jgi:hypothetical protein